ncbi:radical SAM family heme chaperone HemW [Dysgonomonas sp. 216]|uniref:radical SAM family heme chaperone HemW n=1 Tax=Dysgonomonas sp. 216 TaxID=2302934 RepID=UPI0013D1A41F|nr:radical SAM family heme chaperone HemW [Dysgonomonas sp. 216]NDW19103.1 radical SAM family heme chaperone HemW [Dysgonomonas sp. 216]
MAGIYIHVPFCKTRCIYCDFYSQTNTEIKSRYINAVCDELELRKMYLNKEYIKTIYFGGGTPSQLTESDFRIIFETIYSNYKVDSNAEITIETNPDDLNFEYIKMLRGLPFNRLSLGIQSFDDDDLTFLNRRHSAEKAIRAIKDCQQAGFDNISIDLMYGLPEQTVELWTKNIEKAIELNVQHISAYHLIYEENTPIYNLLKKGDIKNVSEEVSNQLFTTLKTKLEDAGFIHYEISNFAKPDFESKHNSSYWKSVPYMGIGPSAHSYNGKSRSWNIASIAEYIKGVEGKQPVSEEEILDINSRYNDYILTRLRTVLGADAEEIRNLFGQKMLEYFLLNARKHIDNGYIIKEHNNLRIASVGLLISDGIMSDLMYID